MRTFILRDACQLVMERELTVFFIIMTILARFILNQKVKADRYRTECLRYRGVVYKKMA